MTLPLAALILWGSCSVAVLGIVDAGWLIGIGGLVGLVALLAPANRRAFAALLASMLFLSGVSLIIQSELLKPDWVKQYISESQELSLELEILNQPKRIFFDFNGQPQYGVAVGLRKVSNQSVSARGYMIYPLKKLQRGEVVLTQARLEEPGRSARDAFLIRSKDKPKTVQQADSVNDFFNGLREDFAVALRGVTPDSKALVAGLAIGDVSSLSDELSQMMRDVSLTHLVAVSGSNCAIVIGLVYLFAVRIGFARYGRAVISALGLIAYVALIGPDPSVLRAGVMALAVILALALGRRGWSVGALALAATVLLIADPWLAVEFGFGLSVLATAGILLLAPAIAEKLSEKMPKWLALALGVTIGAQLMCLPLLTWLQPGLLTYSILANLLAGVVVAPVTVLGMLALLFAPSLPSLASGLSWLASLGGFWIECLAQFFSSLPLVQFPWLAPLAGSLVAIGVIVAVGLWLRGPSVAARKLGLAAVMVVAVSTLSVPAAGSILPRSYPLRDWQFVACDVGQGDGILIASGGRVALIDTGPDEGKIDSCLKELGVQRIDLLVLTHFDFDHVGGLAGALRGRKTAVAVISAFEDTRPATEIAMRQLRESANRIVLADNNLSGVLGEFSWQVLSESAVSASDSNDGSTVLLFKSKNWNLLLTGDLGEPGQLRVLETAKREIADEIPLVLKVSHHGSSDQSALFHQQLRPEVAIISVGKENGYGHPTSKSIQLLESVGAVVLRTDQIGSISLGYNGVTLSYAGSGG